MRRIMMISEHASPLAATGSVDSGGQNVYVAYLSRALARQGYQVDVFTRRDSTAQPKVQRWFDGVRVFHVPAGPPAFVRKEDLLPYMREFTSFCAAAHARAPYELVHANFWMSGLVAADLKAVFGLPFVITFHALGKVRKIHQGTSDGFPEARSAIEERLVREADRIVAECPQDEEDLVQLYGADPAKITIVPCGIDRNHFYPEPKARARLQLGIRPKSRLILQLGRVVPRKGIDDVIRALGLMAEDGRHDDLMLAVVGGSSYTAVPERCRETSRLMELARSLRVENQVRFVGRRNLRRLRLFYSAADVFVTTPWYEPFGITPLEAMACGTPIVGSCVGGIKYSVRDGETGLLVPPKDPRALAKKLSALLQRPNLLNKFSAAGRQRVLDHFTWDNVAAQVGRLYGDLLRPAPEQLPPQRIKISEPRVAA